jgi:hypothetical protein
VAKAASAGIIVEGLREASRAIGKLDKDSQKAAGVEIQKVADLIGRTTAAAGRARGQRDAAVASSYKPSRARNPTVRYGGSAPSGVSGGATMGDLVFGMEFGADQTGPNRWRFPPRTPKYGRGNEGYWIFPTARKMGPDIVQLWADALEKVIREAGE